ncbi:MAG: RNA polymerase sigma factor [Bryobacteraceae bacterium]
MHIVDVQQEDVIGFEDLYETYAASVYRFALRLSHNVPHAEDLTAETFLRVWNAAQPVRIQTVRAYLFTIVRNLYLQKQRKVFAQVPITAAIENTLQSTPLDWEIRDRFQRVTTAIADLPEADRAGLLLRIDEDLSYEEIGQVLGTTAAAARVRVHRARLKVATLLRSEEAQK